MAKNRVDVVVGVSPEMAARLEAYRQVLEDRKGGDKVTKTEAIRTLLTIALRDRLPRVIAQQLPPLPPIAPEAEAIVLPVEITVPASVLPQETTAVPV